MCTELQTLFFEVKLVCLKMGVIRCKLIPYVYESSPHESMKAQRGGIALPPSLSLALDIGRQSALCPGLFTPGKETRYPPYSRLGGPHCWSRRVWKISASPGFDPQAIQPVAIHYTHYAIRSILCPSRAELLTL